MSTQVTRDKANIHKILAQHVKHEISLGYMEQHVVLWCKTCGGPAEEQFVYNKRDPSYMVLKTEPHYGFVGFFINTTDTKPVKRAMDG